MADEAFALSPISARAALPGDEDYAAISEAFMETSRGRWFLGEYARRNRNADTSMVLDAVARIEHSLVAQKQDSVAQREESLAALQETAAADARLAEAKLTETLAAIRDAIGTAQASAVEALDGLALNERLTPIRKGARVIREIAWRLREIGNDSRICDLIDSQVSVIENGADQIGPDAAKTALEAAFAAVADRLAEFSDPAPVPVAELSAAAPDPAPPELHPVADVATIAPAYATLTPPETAATVDITAEAAEADDEAMLDMIALEMGAPDPFDDDEFIEPVLEDAPFATPSPAAPEILALEVLALEVLAPEIVAPEIVAQWPQPVLAPAEPAPRTVVAAPPEPALEISLGSSILASGIVRKPGIAANDPLAPIRRMSQTEKIAFFS